jgi:hypothetical protein
VRIEKKYNFRDQRILKPVTSQDTSFFKEENLFYSGSLSHLGLDHTSVHLGASWILTSRKKKKPVPQACRGQGPLGRPCGVHRWVRSACRLGRDWARNAGPRNKGGRHRGGVPYLWRHGATEGSTAWLSDLKAREVSGGTLLTSGAIRGSILTSPSRV